MFDTIIGYFRKKNNGFKIFQIARIDVVCMQTFRRGEKKAWHFFKNSRQLHLLSLLFDDESIHFALVTQ